MSVKEELSGGGTQGQEKRRKCWVVNMSGAYHIYVNIYVSFMKIAQ
jgi:hypothetical protein